MVGRLFGFFDPLGIRQAELLRHSLQPSTAGCIQGEEFLSGEKQEIFHFDQYPIADQGVLGEIVIQVLDLMAVTAVDRGDGCQWNSIPCKYVHLRQN